MICQTLRDMVDRRLTSAREISALTGASTSTVYRWLAGQSQPEFESVRQLLAGLPNARGQRALLATFAGDSGWHHVEPAPAGADSCQAVDDALIAVRHAARALERVREHASRGALTHDRVVPAAAALDHAVRHCLHVQRALLDGTKHRHATPPAER